MIRMRIALLVTLCFIFSGLAFGQKSLFNQLNNQVVKLYRQGNYAEAAKVAQSALHIAEKTFGRNHPTVATTLNNLALLYYTQERYSEAESLYKRALAIYEKALGKNHPEVAQSLNNLAEFYHQQGQYSEAEPLYKRSLAIREKAQGKHHPDVAISLNNLAELYRKQGKYSEAEPLYKKSLVIWEKTQGENHPYVATALNNLAALYQTQGKYSAAEPLHIRALAIDEKALGKDHPSVAADLNNLAVLYKSQGKYSEAEPLYKRSLAIREKALGKNHPDVAVYLNNLAELYRKQEKYSEAVPLFKRSLAILEKARGKNHPYVAAALNNLALLYSSEGQYSEAEPLYKRSLAIWEKALGKNHPRVANSLNNLAVLYRKQGKYSSAEPLYKRSLAIKEKALGKNHPDVANSLNGLAESYRVQGKYAEAEPLYKKSLAIWEKTQGENHPYVATALNNLAALYQTQGKYSAAEPLHIRALAIDEKALGKDHPSVAADLNNLAGLYKSQGKYSEAEPLLKRSLAIWEKALGKDRPDVATALNNLAELYREQGKYSEAEPLYKRALAIWEKALAKEHPNAAKCLSNLALLYDAQGKYSEAEPLHRRALAIHEKALGNNHPSVAIDLNNLAVLYQAQGKYSSAEPLYKRSLAIRERILGNDHPSVATALGNLGVLYQDHGDYEHALRMFRRALAIRERAGIPTLGPKNLIANLYLDQGDLARAAPLVNEAGYLPTKGRFHLLTSEYEKAKGSYEAILRQAEKNRNAEDLFSAYTGLGMAFEGLGDYTQAAAHYRKAVDFTEELRSSLPSASRETLFDVRVSGFYRTAPYEGLARVLMRMDKPTEALRTSEYTKARAFAEAISRLPSGTGPDIPQAVLKKDAELTDRLVALRQQRIDAYKKENQARIQALEFQIQELEKEFAAHKEMLRRKYPLFASTKYPEPMDLSQTALENGEWVISYDVTDPGVIIYVTRGKELVKELFKPMPRKELDDLVRRFREPLEVGPGERVRKKLAAFDFASGKKLSDILLADILPDLPENKPVIIVPDDSLGVLPFEMLVLNGGGEVKTDRKIPYVAGAQFFGDRNPISYSQSITALTLARTLGRKRKAARACLVLDDPVFSADDDRVKRLAQKKKKVLLASLPDKLMSIKTELGVTFPRLPLTGELGKSLEKLDPGDTDEYCGMKACKSVLFKNPLDKYQTMVFATHGYFGKDLPGIQEPVLILTLVDQPKDQDGFLRMSEVMGLKMNADIVALTACQTGLGKRITGEGTMGMGRAFQYAGAKSVLISLWSVAEKSSVMLVESFFQHLKEGKKKLQALTLARKEIREAGYDHPFYWAPFILVGEMH